MARVPVAAPGGSVEARPIATPYQSANAPIEAFGGGGGDGATIAARALEKTADQTAKLALTQVMENNEREAKQLDIEYSNAVREIGYGNGTEENQGYFSAKGENAINGYGSATKAMQEARAKIAAKATNSKVQEMFGLSAAAREQQELRSYDRHLMDQRRIANDTASEGRLGAAADDAAANFTDPKILSRSQHIAKTEIEDMARRNGWSAEVAQQKLVEANSVIVQGSVKAALAADNVVQAQKIFDAQGDNLTAKVRNELATQLRDGNVSKQAQALRDRALELFPDDPEKGVKWIMQHSEGKIEDEAISRSRQIYSIQKETEADKRRVETQAREDATYAYTLKQREKQQAKDDAYATAEKHIEDGKPFSSLPYEVRAHIDGNKEAWLIKRQQQIATGEPVATNWERYTDYTRMNADELRNVDLAKARTELADQEFSQVRNLVASANQGRLDPKSPSSPTGMFLAKAKDIGLDKPSKKDENGRLQSMFLQEIAKEEEATKKKISDEKMRDILNKLIDPIVIKGKVWDSEEHLYDQKITPEFKTWATKANAGATEANIARAFIRSKGTGAVPKEYREWAIQTQQKANKPAPTDEQIARAYLANPYADQGKK